MRKIISGLITAMAVIALTACSLTPAQPETDVIINDIATHGSSIAPAASLTISNAEVLETVRDSETKDIALTVEVVADDGNAQYVYYVTLDYRRGEDRKWIYDGISTASVENWTVTPIAGVREGLLREALLGETVTVDGDEWVIDEDNIAQVIIDSQNTHLDSGKDFLTVTYRVNDEVLVASAQVYFEYVFDRSWKLDKFYYIEPFTTSERNDIAQLPDDDAVLADMIAEPLPYGVIEQVGEDDIIRYIDITEGDVAGFTKANEISTNKGKNRELHYTFSIRKGPIEFEADAAVTYIFEPESGWVLDGVLADVTVSAADLEETTWAGEHTIQVRILGESEPPRPMTLEITEINGDEITAELSFEYGGSTIRQRYTGTFDRDTLFINMGLDEWITSVLGGYNHFFYEKTFSGYLFIDDMTLRSITEYYHEHRFILSLKEH